MSGKSRTTRIRVVNQTALTVLPTLLQHWLPGGRIEGCEYVVRNPMRDDRRPGSFRINVKTGRWADFATEHKGRGAVSLAAYRYGLTRSEAARRLAKMLELNNAS